MKWIEFYRCPNTGKTIKAFSKDKTVACTCGINNPKAPHEGTPQTGTHIAKLLEHATEEEILRDDPGMQVLFDAFSQAKTKS